MELYRKCKFYRRIAFLTAFCCTVMCYTVYITSTYPLLTDSELAEYINMTSYPKSTTDRPSPTKGLASPWQANDYAVRVWFPRRIQEGTEPVNLQGGGGAALATDQQRMNSARTNSKLFSSGLSGNGSGSRWNIASGGAAAVESSSTTERRLPEALIIGVKKCGTRALLEFLRIHPDVRAAGPETHFFDRFYSRGLEWYRQQMPLSLNSQITMEKTPSYFITREVPERLYRMSPSVKLIVVVRDPVTRAISDYTQSTSKRGNHTSPTFDQMTFRNRTTGLVDTSWSAIRIGVYSRYLEWWIKFFKLNQIHFVSGENLIKDPAGEMALVQDFLGLKRVITDKHFYFNETKGFPCLKKSEGNGNPHCLGKTKGRTHPDIPSSTIFRLRDFYRPFNLKFYQMTGRDFGWL